MDDTTRLAAIADIHALMARRVRCLDEKDWAGFAACYADDAISHSFVTPERPDDSIVGAQAIGERVAAALAGSTTVHQLHTPELTIIDDDSATGIWPLNDIIVSEANGQRRWMRGYGHYRQTYRKQEGRWLIQDHRLTRLLVETGTDTIG